MIKTLKIFALILFCCPASISMHGRLLIPVKKVKPTAVFRRNFHQTPFLGTKIFAKCSSSSTLFAASATCLTLAGADHYWQKKKVDNNQETTEWSALEDLVRFIVTNRYPKQAQAILVKFNEFVTEYKYEHPESTPYELSQKLKHNDVKAHPTIVAIIQLAAEALEDGTEKSELLSLEDDKD